MHPHKAKRNSKERHKTKPRHTEHSTRDKERCGKAKQNEERQRVKKLFINHTQIFILTDFN